MNADISTQSKRLARYLADPISSLEMKLKKKFEDELEQ